MKISIIIIFLVGSLQTIFSMEKHCSIIPLNGSFTYNFSMHKHVEVEYAENNEFLGSLYGMLNPTKSSDAVVVQQSSVSSKKRKRKQERCFKQRKLPTIKSSCTVQGCTLKVLYPIQRELHGAWHKNGSFLSCDSCQLAFGTNSGFTKHMTLCHGKKNYSCEVCKKKFVYESVKKAHEETHKPKISGIERCLKCTVTFDNKKELKKHTGTAHNLHLTCKCCAIRFCSRGEQRQHQCEFVIDVEQCSKTKLI